jgi:hypothetical protein
MFCSEDYWRDGNNQTKIIRTNLFNTDGIDNTITKRDVKRCHGWNEWEGDEL